MCGILGIFGFNFINAEDSLHLQNHRGPDNTGIWQKEDVFLGHKRLSIIDLNPRSNQPFKIANEVIIFNGEIYNYEELAKEHHLDLTTTSDTEVVLLMYQKYKEKCLAFFNGMFSFVIYNTTTKKYFVARDRLGIKPLYWHHDSYCKDIFSSEVCSIKALISTSIDSFSVRQYEKLRMCVNNDTFFKEIKQFPAAHYMYSGEEPRRYWDIDLSFKEEPSDSELFALLSSSVSYRAIADVNVGSYLSGGLDSTIITALLKPENSWTVGFEDLNEFKWAEIASELYQTDHEALIVDEVKFWETMEFMVKKRGEPLSVPNEVLIYLMTKRVKTKNTVVLSGEGADELFFGYDRIFKWANSSNEFDILDFDEKYSYGKHSDLEVMEYALSKTKGQTRLEKVNYYFLTNHIQGLLRRLDNSTMLCSVEGRVPFLDHRLVDRIAGVSFDWKMGSTFKSSLKRVFSKIVPKDIIQRKKMGFPVPISYENWIKKNLEMFN
ncbi:MAG: asparagine synthase (glutamine-hydrolyzing) [Marine Group III euryarchaeote CG-Epi4]|uniref:Putative asparagine synthetase [glutamine-hydrolyzing] n=1 Tax=Marine Group III euryarchaeote CG-Epi4 TaxID=1888998 RepID=A0A1J5TKB5_9ARCH|nr:MAG: asparagine synthase (glutamine-hydrolyzing) [Marine Group III euryarchaeote CG-Epi4]